MNDDNDDGIKHEEQTHIKDQVHKTSSTCGSSRRARSSGRASSNVLRVGHGGVVVVAMAVGPLVQQRVGGQRDVRVSRHVVHQVLELHTPALPGRVLH